MPMLEEGTKLEAERLGAIVVGRFLGDGFQGEVYEALCGAQLYALKWYFPPTDVNSQRRYDDQRSALTGADWSEAGLIERGPPDSRFLWPLDYVEDDARHFGYLMALRPSRFRSAEELTRNLILFPRTGPYRRQAAACLDLIDCFRELHSSGLCYQDLNLGAPFFDFETGEALLCDNNNVRPNGTEGLVFSMAYAAPEVVRGDTPLTISSDEHALAVLLYQIWVREHPLHGARDVRAKSFNDQWKHAIYGEDPRFMFHPTDGINRPTPERHMSAIRNWPRLPNFLRAAFLKTFTDGLSDPEARLKVSQWSQLISRLRDSLFTCSSCSKETFYDRALVQKGTANLGCVWCRRPNPLPARIRVGPKNDVVMLSNQSLLYTHHLRYDFKFKEVVADVVSARRGAGLGLRNRTSTTWSYTVDGEASMAVVPKGVLPLDRRCEVHFGGGKGLIVPSS